MSSFTFQNEISSSISPARMFKALAIDADKLIPKIMPNAFKSVEILEGDGGPGTVKVIHFGEGGSSVRSVKHQIESIDKESLTYSYTIIEGEGLGETIEKISYEIKIVADGAGGGSICKSSSTYHTKEGVDLKEEQIKAGKEKAQHLFKAIETYLQENPNECN